MSSPLPLPESSSSSSGRLPNSDVLANLTNAQQVICEWPCGNQHATESQVQEIFNCLHASTFDALPPPPRSKAWPLHTKLEQKLEVPVEKTSEHHSWMVWRKEKGRSSPRV